jgi:hypothetical protein
MATRQQEKQADQEELEEQQPEENGAGGLHVDVDEDLIVIELPRDGKEADTLSRLSKFVDGM